MDDYDLRFFGAMTSRIRRKYKLAENARLADQPLLARDRFVDVPPNTSGIALFWIVAENPDGWLCIFTTRELVLRVLGQAPTLVPYSDIVDWRSNKPFGLGGDIRSSLAVYRSDGTEFAVSNCDFDCLSICVAILSHHHHANETHAD